MILETVSSRADSSSSATTTKTVITLPLSARRRNRFLSTLKQAGQIVETPWIRGLGGRSQAVADDVLLK